MVAYEDIVDCVQVFGMYEDIVGTHAREILANVDLRIECPTLARKLDGRELWRERHQTW